MPDLRRTRKSLKTALAIMAGIDVLAAVVYFSPLVGSAESRRQELNTLQVELVTKTRQVAPLKDLPEKVKLASHQIDDQGKYKMKEAEAGRLEVVEIEADFAGSYSSLARFINALERDEMFFIINSVTLGGQTQGPVRLAIKLETYLKARS
jgi:hypothetical protein